MSSQSSTTKIAAAKEMLIDECRCLDVPTGEPQVEVVSDASVEVSLLDTVDSMMSECPLVTHRKNFQIGPYLAEPNCLIGNIMKRASLF